LAPGWPGRGRKRPAGAKPVSRKDAMPAGASKPKSTTAQPWEIVDASFAAGAAALSELPPVMGAELAFAGRSNVGKSSLMNTLLGRKRLVRTSSTPGCTRKISFFRARSRDGAVLWLVDLPGYGYAERSKGERAAWARLIEGYLERRDSLRAVVVLIDVRQGLTDADAQLVRFLESGTAAKPRIILVATKLDKVPKSQQRAHLAKLKAATAWPVIGASAETGEGAAEIWRQLREAALAAAGP
jgi:GTP-binding protein